MAEAPPRRPGRGHAPSLALVTAAATVLAALTLLWPLAGRGLPLTYDMVWTPWRPSWELALGLGPGLPRAVPGEGVLAVAGLLLPTWALSRICLVGVVVLGAVGVARHQRSAGGVVVAVLGWTWGAYTVERLVIGHWMLLAAAAAVPWVCLLATRTARDGAWRSRWRWWLTALPAALTPSGAVLWWLVSCLSLLAVRGRGWRRPVREGVGASLVAAALAAPWVVAGLTGPDARSDPAGVEVFAARAENLTGVLGSLLAGGGIWNAQVVPWSRTGAFGVAATVVLLALAATGLASVRGRGDAARALVFCGGLALVLVALAGTAPGTQLLGRAVAEVPGSGLLRDTQKWLAPWAALLAVAAGWGVDGVRQAVHRRWGAEAGAVPAAAVAVVAAVLLPGALAASSALHPVRFPDEWGEVRAQVQSGGGAVAVAPWGAFRAFSWTGGRTTLDPAPRALPVTVLTSDDLVVGSTTVPGEDPELREVGAALGRGDVPALRRAGVGFVLVHRTAGQHGGGWSPAGGSGASGGAERVLRTASLELWRLPGEVAPRDVHEGRTRAVVGAHALAALGACVVALGTVLTRRTRKATSR